MSQFSEAYQELVDLIELTEHQVSDDLHETFMLFVMRLKQVLDIQAIGLFCPEEHRSEKFVLATHFGFQKYLPLTQDWETLQKIYDWVLGRGRLICLPSDLEPGKNDLLLPLFQLKNRVGILHLISAQEPLALSQHQQVVLNYFGHQMARSLTYVNLLKQQETALQLDTIREMGFILSGVLHELNSPLTAIHGYIHLLAQEFEVSDTLSTTGEDYLNVLKAESYRMTQMVRSLLKYIRHQPLVLETVSLNTLLQESVSLMRKEMGLAQIQVSLNLASDDVLIKAEPIQIQQVFVNILSNAIQAFEERDSKERRIDISTQLVHSQALVKICDTAGGITQHNQMNLFKPLFTTKPPGKGAGLGLSLSYKIVAAHQGHIKAFNVLNPPGACFELVFPLVHEAETSEATTKILVNQHLIVKDESPEAKQHILIVDNELPVLHYLKLVLEKRNYLVTAASSGQAALSLLSQQTFDLIISDFYLDDMTGDSFIKSICQTTPILFLTGAVLNTEAQNFLREKGLACMYKPFYEEELIFELKKRLNGKNK